MNTDPRDVYSFIHLMSSSERRYFSSRHRKASRKEEPQFYQFYEFILEEKIVSDEQLRQHHAGAAFVDGKHISMEKKRLFDQLLTAMVDYDATSTPSIMRKRVHSETESLVARGYVTLAQDRLNILKDKASKIGNWPLLIESSIIEGSIRMIAPTSIGIQEIQERSEERLRLLRMLEVEVRLREVWDSLLFLKWRPKTEGRETMLEETGLKLSQISQDQLAHVSLQQRFDVCHALLALLKGDNKVAQKHYKQVVETLQNNPFLTQESPGSAMIHLYNYLNIAHSNRDYRDFLNLLPKVERLEKELNRNGRNQNNYARMLWILYYANNRQLGKAAQLAIEQFKEQPTPVSGVPLSNHLVMRFNAIVLLFFTCQYVPALELIEEILAHQRFKIRSDLKDALLVFQVVLLYELGQEEMLLTKLSSLRARQPLNAISKPYFKLVVGLLNDCYDSKLILNGHMIQWDQYIVKLDEILQENRLLQHFGVFELRLWVYSKAHNLSMEDALANHPAFAFPNNLAKPETLIVENAEGEA